MADQTETKEKPENELPVMGEPLKTEEPDPRDDPYVARAIVEENEKRERALAEEEIRKAEEARIEAERHEELAAQRENERIAQERQWADRERQQSLIAEVKARQDRAREQKSSRPSSYRDGKVAVMEGALAATFAGQNQQAMREIARAEAAKAPSAPEKAEAPSVAPIAPVQAAPKSAPAPIADQKPKFFQQPKPAANAPSNNASQGSTVERLVVTPAKAVENREVFVAESRDAKGPETAPATPTTGLAAIAAAHAARANEAAGGSMTPMSDEAMRTSSNPELRAGRIDYEKIMNDPTPEPAREQEPVAQAKSVAPAQAQKTEKPSMLKAFGDRVGQIKSQVTEVAAKAKSHVTAVASKAKDRATEFVGKAKEAITPKEKSGPAKAGQTKPQNGLKPDQKQNQPQKPSPEEIAHKLRISELNRDIAAMKQRAAHFRAKEAEHKAQALTHQKEAMALSAMLQAARTPAGEKDIIDRAVELKQQDQVRSQQQGQARQAANTQTQQPQQRQVQPQQRQAATISR